MIKFVAFNYKPLDKLLFIFVKLVLVGESHL